MEARRDDHPGEGHIAFRTDLLPVLIVEFEGAVDDGIFEQYLDTITAFARKREHVAVVVNADGTRFMTEKQRQLQADWLERNEVILRTYLVAIAFVAGSAPMRIVLRSVLSKYADEKPFLVVETEDEAIDWADQQLKSASVEASE